MGRRRAKGVKVDVRITPEHRLRLAQEQVRLLGMVYEGHLSADEAMTQMGALNLRLTEYRLSGGDWRPLAEA